MGHLAYSLRVFAVLIASPLLCLYLALAVLAYPISALRGRLQTPLWIWMAVLDWTKGIPVGYSYWEQYQAPTMLDELAVHHDD